MIAVIVEVTNIWIAKIEKVPPDGGHIFWTTAPSEKAKVPHSMQIWGGRAFFPPAEAAGRRQTAQ